MAVGHMAQPRDFGVAARRFSSYAGYFGYANDGVASISVCVHAYASASHNKQGKL